MNGLNYLEIVGVLLYATQTHPDIQFAVGLVAQFSSNPGPHLEAAKHILRYLKGTADQALVLGWNEQDTIDLIGWTDSDWAQDPDSRWSIGSFIFDVAGGSVSWSAKKQPTITLSTVEAKYMVAANATKEAIWLQVLLEDLGYPQTCATIIHTNNQGCIALMRNPVTHSHAKHIDIWHHFIRKCIATQDVTLQYCPSKENLADIFTKQLPCKAHEKLRIKLGLDKIWHLVQWEWRKFYLIFLIYFLISYLILLLSSPQFTLVFSAHGVHLLPFVNSR